MSYLTNLYRGAPADHLLAIWSKTLGITEFNSTADLDRAEERLIELSSYGDVYFGWCPLMRRPAGRGTAQDVGSSPGIMFDADLFSDDPKVHKQSALPRTLGEVVTWLDEAGIERPTQIRSSGNGLYLDWLHPQPAVFTTDANREAYAKATRDFHAALRKSALERRGWRFDNTSDLARVTRMPGTLNHKTTPPKPVEIINV
ncbi:hypothetical protein ACWCOP_00465 [Maricaulaceae bacterium MS644]